MDKVNLKVEGIGFENFRIFKNRTDMDFRTITVLTGTNSSGKSTVINAMRLLKGNYSGLRFSEFPSEFELDSLFDKQFDVGDIIRRFGDLEKFVSYDSGNEFAISLHKKMPMIDHMAVIEFTVKIQKNNLKNGRLIKLQMKSKSTGVIFFSIKEIEGIKEIKDIKKEKKDNKSGFQLQPRRSLNSFDRYVTNIDLIFFYHHFLQWINFNVDYYKELINMDQLVIKLNNNLITSDELMQVLKMLNEKYSTDFRIALSKGKYLIDGYSEIYPVSYLYDIIDKSNLVKIINVLKDGKFYDFSMLWADDQKKEKLFKKIISNVYGKYDTDSLQRLTEDILDFLSKKVDWQYSETDHEIMENDLQYSDEKKLHYLYFDKMHNFNNCVAGLSLSDYVNRFGNQSFSSEEVDRIVKGVKIEKKSYLSPGIIEGIKSKDDLIKFLTTLNRIDYKSTPAEKYFYKDFIFHNLNLVKEVFRPFKEAEFVSTDRSGSKRAKSLLDEDDLSRLSKKRFSFNKKDKEKIDEFLNKWVVEFGIAEGVSFDKDKDTENYKVFVKKNNQNILLADMGFGVSQLLPIMLSCFPGNKIVAVEEPETNLHPALQSKLADFFWDAAQRFNVQFIIETHSEYLIRKLQYLTAKTDSNLEPEHTIIYYFFHPDKVPMGEDQVKKIYINEDGSLTDDFGTGFFDESDKIAISLWNMSKARKN